MTNRYQKIMCTEKKNLKKAKVMYKNKSKIVGIALVIIVLQGCIPALNKKTEDKSVPDYYAAQTDTNNVALMNWRDYFKDTCLIALIDSAIMNNQELNIALQEINIAKYEVGAKKGEYLPSANLKVGAGAEKVGRYTSQGANDANTEIMEGKETPEYFLGDFQIGINFSWEIDIWKKLRNAKKSAAFRYLSTIEGRNFMLTNLIGEIANAYYELMALDNQLEIVKQNLKIQKDALKIVKLQKDAAKVSTLAITKFKAEVYKNQSFQFELQQQITQTENKINFLVGRFPQKVERSSDQFQDLVPDTLIETGIPSQLLKNRPDIKQRELELAAAKLDIKVARAKFFPSFRITTGIGYQAFNIKYLFRTPQSLMYNLLGDIVAPLINRKAIKAEYFTSNAKQIQAVYEYEKTILNAYVEVLNQMAKIENLKESYNLKNKQVDALTESIEIANKLFKSARADYMEVLLTQRDALESKIELIETKKEQLKATVEIYQALGGGWR